ncbi:hypothetical protein [Lysinibacter sp. HNR]|uniref:hypothetical protein n=1 Tax=Lysinibacter sp. HNR TaxID=3031408 RepID=UPI002435BECA|nr:hypothetical protein [Lysinibacter sp. HNR]WGD36583.1 hypothetical protein FrondiHNR_08905 [Lysinibacter sp. HNR]
MKKVLTAISSLAAALGLALLPSTPVLALPHITFSTTTHTESQQEINRIMEMNPGGVQTAWNEVSWDNGEIVLTLAERNTRSAQFGCGSGLYCVYAEPAAQGMRINFSTCKKNNSVTVLPSVRSIVNATANRTITAHNGNSLLLTVFAGSLKNTTSKVTTVSCS